MIFFAVLVIAQINGQSIECFKRYLSDRNFNEDLLSYVGPYHGGSLKDCESEVQTRLAATYQNLRDSLSRNRLHRPYVECVMRDVEELYENDYESYQLREMAIELSSNWRFWSFFAKRSRLDELRTQSQRFVDRSLLKCKGHREFYELFNKIVDREIKWHRSGEEEYCVRKYLKSKNLLSDTSYGLRENPRNVKTENLECDSTVDEMKEKAMQPSNSTQPISECLRNIYRKKNFADQILKAEVLSKLNLLPTDKSRERQDFTNALIDISYDVNC